MPTSALTTKALSFAEIEEYVVQCTLELFSAHGRPVEPVEGAVAETPGPAVMSVIGFATTGIRGALLLLSPRDAVSRLVPMEFVGRPVPIEHLLRDVLGEFANMLAGRVRNRLHAHGLDPLVATPTTVLGDALRVPAPRSGLSAWHRFVGSDIDLFVRLDATFETSFALPAADEAKALPFREGEMVLF
jgi:hypothetical protein